TIGSTRMRVRLLDSSLGANLTPCGTSSYGQVEDYTLNIGALAVSDVSKNGIKAYPNPVRDIYNIEAQGKIKNVKVYDVTGKQLFVKDINEAKSQIDFSRFNSGVYIVTTTMEDGSTTSSKVIKK
ncbi:MAG: T9SS type A sorting domain-containing protein, partial [Chryseobacterium sp.]|nr:T9SS type A sorting domain-containing protein [Chryseobacterium sp.]